MYFLDKIKWAAIFIVLQAFILNSCSTGIHNYPQSTTQSSLTSETTVESSNSHQSQKNIFERKQCPEIKQNLAEAKNNTVFVHPGLLFPIPWGMQRARDSGNRVVDKGLASNMFEVRSRNSKDMYKRMLTESGRHYFGIHYSMGGAPSVIKAAIKAARLASNKLQHHITYSAILVEPYQFPLLIEEINLDDPHLGQVIVVISSQNSIFRPDISRASNKILTNNKFHFIYAEEINMKWNHFTFLSQVRSNNHKNDKNIVQAKELFDSITFALASKLNSNQINNMIHNLKINYSSTNENNTNSNPVLTSYSTSCSS